MTKEQLGLLKSFTKVSQSMIIKKGTMGVISPDESCCLFYDCDFEEFDKETKVYDVNQLLSVIETFGTTSQISVDSSNITIKNGNKKVKYLLSNGEVVKGAPLVLEEKFESFDKDYVFVLNKDDLVQIKKVGSVLGLNKITISAEKKKIVIQATNSEASSDAFRIELDGKIDSKESCSIFISELNKIIECDYEISVSSVGMSKFVSQDIDGLRYYIANVAE